MVNEATAFVRDFYERKETQNNTYWETFRDSGEILIGWNDIFLHLWLNKTHPLINTEWESVTLNLKVPTQATYNSLENSWYVLAWYLLPSNETSWEWKYPESFQKLEKVDWEEIILFYSEWNTLVKLFFIKSKINKEILWNQTNFKSLVSQILPPNK